MPTKATEKTRKQDRIIPTQETWQYKLKFVFLNAFLLLLPTLIFIVVKVNVQNYHIEWRLDNVIKFFVLYATLLSLFVFKPHTMLLQTPKVKTFTQYSRITIGNIAKKPWAKIALAFIFLVLPWVMNLYHTKVFIYVYVFLIFAIGLNYTVGYAGLLNLGHVLPFAAGAYSYGLIFKYFQLGFFSGLLLGAFVGMCAGWAVSLITLRLNGDYLAIVTLAIAEIFKLLANNVDTLTGGARGIPGIPLPKIAGIQISFIQRYIMLYYIAGILVLVAIFVATRLVKSRYGRSWEAMREDPIAAESMGINLHRVRMIVFAIGGFYAGVAGVLEASRSTYVSPASVALLYSITVLSIVVLGGMGSIKGAILGTVMVILLPEYLRTFENYRMLIYGLLLVVMMRYRQRGLLPLTRTPYPLPPKYAHKVAIASAETKIARVNADIHTHVNTPANTTNPTAKNKRGGAK